MKIYKWLRGLMKASALTTVMFIMQACYGTPNAYQYEMNGVVVDKMTGHPLKDIEYQIDGQTRGYTNETGHFEVFEYEKIPTNHQLSFIDSVGRYQTFDTLIQDFYSYDLKIKLESNQ
jgi:hypothetical protein